MEDSVDLTCHEVLEECIEASISVEGTGGSQESCGVHHHHPKELSLSPCALPRRKALRSVKSSERLLLSQQGRIQKCSSIIDEGKGKRGALEGGIKSLSAKRKKKQETATVADAAAVSESVELIVADYIDPLHTVLPTEIRCKILEQFPTSDLLLLRLVSRQWKDTIDSITSLDVKIDGEYNKQFKGKCGLTMASCTLVNFQNPSHRQLFRTSGPPKNILLRNGICYVNFEELLLQWCNLTQLDLCWRTLVKNLLFGKSTSECSLALKKNEILPSLKHLRFELLTNDNLVQRSKQRILSNVTNLASYNYPCLKHISVVFVGYRELHTENRYMPILLDFLSRQSATLTLIDFILKYASHVVYPPAHPRHILFCVPANLTRSKKKTCYTATDSHLIKTQLRKPSSTPQDHEEWMKMLGCTRRLEIAILTRFLSWSIKHLDYFASTINEYAKFLRVVDVMNVTMYDSGAHNTITLLDMKVFNQCPQLAELRIYRAPIIFHEDEVDPPSELINLHKLPISLEEVTVDGLPVESIDILEALRALKNLKTFSYFQSQVPRRNMLFTNGISWEVLQVIIKHPTLRSVKVHVTNQGSFHLWYEDEFQTLSREHGWNTSGITPGYMNMHQITLTKS